MGKRKNRIKKGGENNAAGTNDFGGAPWVLVALSILALLAAVGGLHIEYAAGDANRYFFLDHGGGAVEYYDSLKEHGLPLSFGTQAYNFIYPDISLILWLSHLTDNALVGTHLFAMLCVLVTAAGLWLLVRELWGARLAWLALPVAALPSLLMAYNIREEFFVTAIMPFFRGGLLALLPLFLWLSVRILFVGGRRYYQAAALFVLLFFLFNSFTIILTWYIAPVFLALLGCWAAGKKPDGWKIYTAVIIVAYFLAAKLQPFMASLFFEFPGENNPSVALSLHGAKKSVQLFGIWLGDSILRLPILFLLWAAFLLLMIRLSWLAARNRLSIFADSPNSPNSLNSLNKMRNAIFLFVGLFIVFSMLVQPAAAILTGKFGVWGRLEHFANHRYFLPAVYWPLFWGWLLLVGFGAQRLQVWAAARQLHLPFWAVKIGRIEGVFSGAVFLAAAVLYGDAPALGGLARYSSPFLSCVEENAKKHNISGAEGYASADFASYFRRFSEHLYTFTVLNKAAWVRGVHRKELPKGNDFPLFMHPDTRTHYGDNPTPPKNPQYIVVNTTDETKNLRPPELARCPMRLQNPDSCYDHGKWDFTEYYYIDEKTVTDYWGEPQDKFRCEGVDFYLYPPGKLVWK